MTLAGCSDRPPAVPPPAAHLDVEFAGCAEVWVPPDGASAVSASRAGPEVVCSLDAESSLALWVRVVPDQPVQILVDGRTQVVDAGVAIDGGALHRLRLPAEAHVLEVRAGSVPSSRWSLGLTAAKRRPLFERAEALKREGKLEEAEQSIAAVLSALPVDEQARAHHFLGRVVRQRGQAERAVQHLQTALSLYRRLGLVSAETEAAAVLSFTFLNDLGDLARARQALEGQPAAPAAFPEGAAYAPYYLALVAFDVGDTRGAARLAREAERRMARLGLEDLGVAARNLHARALYETGRPLDAAVVLRSLLASPSAGRSCPLAAQLETSLGFALTLAGQLDEARAALARSLALRGQTCPDAIEEANVLGDLALVEVLRGDANASLARLAEARARLPRAPTRLATWWLDTEGRVALLQGQPDLALAHYDRLTRIAQAGGIPELLWRAALARGEALLAKGERGAALASLREAQALARSAALRIPLGHSRATYLGDRAEATRQLVTLLVDDGQPQAALDVMREAGAALLATLHREERTAALSGPARERFEGALSTYHQARTTLQEQAEQDWALPTDEVQKAVEARQHLASRMAEALDDAMLALGEAPPGELAPPAPDELWLAFAKGTRGWFVFAASEDGVRVVEVGAVEAGATPASLGAAWLGPFAAALRKATRVRLLPTGSLREHDVHLWELDGQPLIAVRPVVYALDLPAPGHAVAEARTDLGDVLLIVDPRGDLPAARQEASAIRASLSSARITALEGQAATWDAVMGGLGRATFVHWAGHGVFGGDGGWSSVLPVFGDAAVTVADILTLPSAPRGVFLSGCETARSTSGAPAETIGLAQAFLAAGASTAIATSRSVGDRAAREVSEAFWRHRRTLPADQAFQRAVLAARETAGGDRSWEAFRMLVR